MHASLDLKPRGSTSKKRSSCQSAESSPILPSMSPSMLPAVAGDAAVASIAFTGELPADSHASCAKYLGVYSPRGEQINGRPSYVKSDGECAIWFYENAKTRKKQWHVGLTEELVAGMMSRAAFYALTPEAATGTWQATRKGQGFVAAPELRMVSDCIQRL